MFNFETSEDFWNRITEDIFNPRKNCFQEYVFDYKDFCDRFTNKARLQEFLWFVAKTTVSGAVIWPVFLIALHRVIVNEIIKIAPFETSVVKKNFNNLVDVFIILVILIIYIPILTKTWRASEKKGLAKAKDKAITDAHRDYFQSLPDYLEGRLPHYINEEDEGRAFNREKYGDDLDKYSAHILAKPLGVKIAVAFLLNHYAFGMNNVPPASRPETYGDNCVLLHNILTFEFIQARFSVLRLRLLESQALDHGLEKETLKLILDDPIFHHADPAQQQIRLQHQTKILATYLGMTAEDNLWERERHARKLRPLVRSLDADTLYRVFAVFAKIRPYNVDVMNLGRNLWEQVVGVITQEMRDSVDEKFKDTGATPREKAVNYAWWQRVVLNDADFARFLAEQHNTKYHYALLAEYLSRVPPNAVSLESALNTSENELHFHWATRPGGNEEAFDLVENREAMVPVVRNIMCAPVEEYRLRVDSDDAVTVRTALCNCFTRNHAFAQHMFWEGTMPRQKNQLLKRLQGIYVRLNPEVLNVILPVFCREASVDLDRLRITSAVVRNNAISPLNDRVVGSPEGIGEEIVHLLKTVDVLSQRNTQNPRIALIHKAIGLYLANKVVSHANEDRQIIFQTIFREIFRLQNSVTLGEHLVRSLMVQPEATGAQSGIQAVLQPRFFWSNVLNLPEVGVDTVEPEPVVLGAGVVAQSDSTRELSDVVVDTEEAKSYGGGDFLPSPDESKGHIDIRNPLVAIGQDPRCLMLQGCLEILNAPTVSVTANVTVNPLFAGRRRGVGGGATPAGLREDSEQKGDAGGSVREGKDDSAAAPTRRALTPEQSLAANLVALFTHSNESDFTHVPDVFLRNSVTRRTVFALFTQLIQLKLFVSNEQLQSMVPFLRQVITAHQRVMPHAVAVALIKRYQVIKDGKIMGTQQEELSKLFHDASVGGTGHRRIADVGFGIEGFDGDFNIAINALCQRMLSEQRTEASKAQLKKGFFGERGSTGAVLDNQRPNRSPGAGDRPTDRLLAGLRAGVDRK